MPGTNAGHTGRRLDLDVDRDGCRNQADRLVAAWGSRCGQRPPFIADVSPRLANRVQLTTDGNRVYVDAVDAHLGGAVDYAMLVKQYGATETPNEPLQPCQVPWGQEASRSDGEPDMDLVSTSYAERQNLNIRMGNRRYTRLTNAFSKKAEMLAYSVAITFMYHNFVRVHQTLKTTPAIKAGIARPEWTIEDMVDLLPLNVPGKRGPYKKRETISD